MILVLSKQSFILLFNLSRLFHVVRHKNWSSVWTHLCRRDLPDTEAAMGGCVSAPSRTIKSQKKSQKKRLRGFKRHGKINVITKKRNSDGGARVADYSVSEVVHMGFENGATATCTRSKVSNSKFHVTELQWHHTPSNNANGLCSLSLMK